MAEDKMVRVAETTEIRRVVTADAYPTEQRSWQDANLVTDTTPSGWREPVIMPVPAPTPAPVPSTDVLAPVVMQGGGDE